MRHTASRGLSVSAVLLLAAGCNYVTTGERTNELNCLDKDGDGAVSAGDLCDQEGAVDDCNDSPATGAMETPGAEEIPYDGWDNDCGRLGGEPQPDLVDVDGDGYPGILKEDWEEIASSTVAWPGGLRNTLDCDDTVASVFPGAVDRPYDGVDADCAGDDDYDQDGDGFVPSAADIEGEPGYAPYAGDKPAGDCNDFSPLFYPGALDAPYDGEDRDCAGNDDYDADGDGHRSALQVGSGTDCDDADPLVNPDMVDAPYDGVDADCGGEDDFDQDGDGYIPQAYESVYTGSGQVGDCDDGDPDAFPGNLEVFLDGADQDCDGGEGATFAVPEEYSLQGPRRPQLRVVDDRFVLSVAGEKVTTRQSNLGQAGMALMFESDPGPTAQPASDTPWKASSTSALYGDFGVEADDDEIAWAFTQDGAGSGDHRLVTVYASINDGALGPLRSSFHVSGRVGVDAVSTTDVALHDGRVFAVGCGAGEALYMRLDPAINETAPADQGDASVGCEHMMVLPTSASDAAYLDYSGSVETYLLGGGALTDGAPRYSLTGVSSMQSHSGLGVIGLSGGGVVLDDGATSSTHLSSYRVLHADAVEHDGVIYIAAIVDDNGTPEIVLAEVDGTQETVADLVWTDGLDPVGVTVEATSNRIMVAAVGSDGSTTAGSLFWAVLER